MTLGVPGAVSLVIPNGVSLDCGDRQRCEHREPADSLPVHADWLTKHEQDRFQVHSDGHQQSITLERATLV